MALSRLFAFWSVLTLQIFVASDAYACEPAPIEYDATLFPAEIVIEGVASEIHGDADKSLYVIEVSTVPFGDYADKRYSFELRWSCPTSSPDIKVGDRIRAYLVAGHFAMIEPIAWESIEAYPKTNEHIRLEQDVARYRKFRSESHFSAGGALSFNDPINWLPADWINTDEMHKLRQTPYSIIVSFKVGKNGDIYGCKSMHVDGFKYSYLDKRACEILSRNANLVPPVFSDETEGFFEWSPPEQNDE